MKCAAPFTERRLLGTIPDVSADGVGGSPLLGAELHVLDAGAARDRPLPCARLAALLLAIPRGAASRVLGEHTDQVLAEVLGLSDRAIGKLRDKRIVGGPIHLTVTSSGSVVASRHEPPWRRYRTRQSRLGRRNRRLQR